MRRFIRGFLMKHELQVDEEYNEDNKVNLINKNLIQCIKRGKNTKYILDDVNCCLEQKADVNTTDEDGNTPLHLAVYCGLDVVVELLLNKNADVNAKNGNGLTPLDVAMYWGETNIATLILNKYADMNAINIDGDTLYVAARAGHEDIVKLLLNKHVNIKARDEFGRTPLHQAVIHGQKNIVTLLLSKNADANATDESGGTPLHDAAGYGQNDIVELLLNKNADVNAKKRCGLTPLHVAISGGEIIIATLLLSKNADVNATDENGDTPLHIAVCAGYKDIVKLLLIKNVNINARGKFGKTPLHQAAIHRETYIVTLLLSKNADVNATDEGKSTPLHDAADDGQEDIVKLLLNKNADVNAKDSCGRTPLHAAMSGHENIVKLMLRQNADVNAMDGFGDKPLHLALRSGQKNISKLLLDRNDNIFTSRGKFRQTLLHIAAESGMTNIVKLLLSKHADINATDEFGDKPLHAALWKGQENIAKLLLDKNVDVNVRGKFEQSPLHIAATCGMIKFATLLISKHADLNATDMFGDTPLHQALREGHKNIAKLLLDKNVDVNARGKFEQSPLHIAATCGMIDFATLLISKHADVNSTDKFGDTPMHQALREGHKNIAKLFLDKNVDVNARGKFEQSPLHITATCGMIDFASLLISKHADVNATDKFGDTPLHQALREGHKNIAKLFLDKNVDVNARGKFEQSPLHITATCGMIDFATLLISKHADVNATDKFGDTPLHQALRKGQKNIVKLLLDLNVDVNRRGKFEETPLHIAAKFGMTDIMKQLFSKHADVHATDINGDTPLHMVARNRQEDMVVSLMKENANVNLRNKLGKLPLHEAIRYKNINTIKLLIGIADVNTKKDNSTLQMGVNVNAKDSAGDTPLHEAARLLDAEIAALLVRYGADVTLKNNTGDTPLFLCQIFSFADNADIVRLLQIAEMEAQKHCTELQSNDPDTKFYNNSHKILKSGLKTIDDFGFSGQLYETKMISLFYLRMLNTEQLDQDLLLGVNINDIGDMDDICLRYRVKDQQRPVVLFIQGKHKKCPKSKLTNNDFWSDCGDFDLRNYFKSYLKIKERFQVDKEDPLFQGDFEDIDCYFILYTSAQESLGTKKKTENKVNKIIHDLINTSEIAKPFQYTYDYDDINHLMRAADVNNSEYYTAHAKNFFSKLWIYTNQAHETKVENIVKKEINKYYNGDANNVMLEQYSDAIFLIIHRNIQEWWRLKNKAPYLTRSNDFFKLAKLIFLADVLLIFCNAVNYFKNNVQLQFNNFLHFTTATVEDLHLFLRELLIIINTSKLNKDDTDFNTLSLDFFIADKRFEHETTMLESDKSQNLPIFLNLSQGMILNNNLYNYNEFKYAKRHGTSEVGGVLLKIQMSSLIFLRALNHAQIDHNTVLLRAKIPGISMTDICLRFQLKNQQKPVMLFMQLIYSVNPDKKKLTAETLWRDSENCSLFKHFSSYLKIKERFRKSNKDDMFKGGYRNADSHFFLCTSIEESLTKKENNQHVSKEVMDLINTGNDTKVFQLDVEIDRLVKVTAKEQLNKLGNYFLKSVLHEKYSQHLLSNNLIGKYHVVMAQEVLQPCEEQPSINEYRMWRFRSEFFNNNLDYLNTLKASFFKMLSSKCYNQNKEKLQSLRLKLPLAFGNVDMAFRNNDDQTDRIKVVASKLMHLLELNKNTKIIELNDDDVGPGKMLQQGIVDINGGIGSAVGNLLIFDTNTKSLKFDLKKKSLPHNANLFLKELKDDRYSPINEDLSVYRFKINVENFPKSSFYDDENDKRQARDFLSKFWIYPIQAKEVEIEHSFKYEINKLVSENKGAIDYKNGNISDLISLIYLNEIQKWWLLPNESPYLKRASELFEHAELAYIYSLLQSVVNFMYMSGTHSIDIKVEQAWDEHDKYNKTKILFEKIASKLLSILGSQQSDQSIELYYLSSLQYKVSKLTLKIHPKMESLLLIFQAELADNFVHRAFAKAGFVHRGSGGKINQAEGKLIIYQQRFFNIHAKNSNVISDRLHWSANK